MFVGYAALALLTSLDPVFVVRQALLANDVREYTVLAALCSSGFVLASATAHCLKEGSQHERLGSDTYKRLNAGLKTWAALLLVLQLISLPATCATSLLVVGAATLPALYVTSQLHEVSNRSLVAFLTGIGELITFKAPAGIPYAAMAIPCILAAPFLLLSSGFPLWSGLYLTAEAIFLKQVLAAAFFLMAVVLYVLKDGAERGRLGSSTFKTLNFAMCVAALLQVQWVYLGHTLAADFFASKLAIGYWALVAGYCGVQFFTGVNRRAAQ